jgi:hypothetical protein
MSLIWLLVFVGLLALIGNYSAFRRDGGSASLTQFVGWMRRSKSLQW